MNPQLAQLRAAWGLARALGRTLVMPRFTCGMDRVWFPHDGVFPGSDPAFTIPFDPCPMDHVSTPGLDAWRCEYGVTDSVLRRFWIRRRWSATACWTASASGPSWSARPR
jgi:hypothetical protein